MALKASTSKAVPEDFPKRIPGSLPGAQLKISARLIDGRYVSGETEDERNERFSSCLYLATQLADYSRRRMIQSPAMRLPDFLRRLRIGVVSKEWDISAEELNWVMRRVAIELGGTSGDVATTEFQVDRSMTTDEVRPKIESVVDAALAKLVARSS